MNRRALVLLTGLFSIAFFAGGTVYYRNAQAERARIVAETRAEAMVRDHSPVIGPANAPVTIVEFFDPSCEACRAFYPPVKQILSMFPQDARLVIRYTPFHASSEVAVRLLEAARMQDKFVPVLEALLEFQPEWADDSNPDTDKAWQRAAAAGLDIERAKKDGASASVQATLDKDMADVKTLEISRTPTFFVNGKPLKQFGPKPLYDLVKEEVEQARR